MFLDTKRLRIREFTKQDAAFIVKLLNEPAFIQHIADKGVRSLKDAERYLEEGPMASYGKFGFGLWHVALKKTGLPIGMCGLLKRDYLEDVDIGFAFLADHWRKGYALEAASAVMAHATGCLGLEKLVAIVGKDNARSVSLLGKLDFRFERYIRLPDETTDVMLMAHQGNGQGMQAGKGEKLAILTGGALDLGASGVKVIAAGDIVIRDELADRCREPGCEHYGKSKSCPPNVAGPSWFRKLLKNYSRAVLFKIDVPSDILFSSERFDVFRLLHTTAAGIEQAGVEIVAGRDLSAAAKLVKNAVGDPPGTDVRLIGVPTEVAVIDRPKSGQAWITNLDVTHVRRASVHGDHRRLSRNQVRREQ